MSEDKRPEARSGDVYSVRGSIQGSQIATGGTFTTQGDVNEMDLNLPAGLKEAKKRSIIGAHTHRRMQPWNDGRSSRLFWDRRFRMGGSEAWQIT